MAGEVPRRDGGGRRKGAWAKERTAFCRIWAGALTMLPLNNLGSRIMVLGPSNAGKSTLALAISEKLDIAVVHLDQLQHLPDTDWQARDEEDFKALHAEAILEESWIMDGNYSRLMQARFERATGVILITSSPWIRLFRYLKRSLRPAASRIGGLKGGPEYIKWEMIHWIVFATAKSDARYAKMIKRTALPSIECRNPAELNQLYENWGLDLKST